MHLLRLLRLQIKSGFLKEEPEAYTFLRRYPPSTPVSNPANKQEYKIPYLKLYKKAVDKNPLFADEKVFPAFWREEPHALTLAKKQYELMQNGLDEDSAYAKSVEFVDELESKSYEELKEFINILKEGNSELPFSSDPKIIERIAYWREQLEETDYEDMTLADQGELDYFIQHSILKWHEVSRERRMKDPLFVHQFQRLKLTLFPTTRDLDQFIHEDWEKLGPKWLKRYGVSLRNFEAASSFYFEDYKEFFDKLKLEPNLDKWTSEERDNFTQWIMDTLAIKQILINAESEKKIRFYLDLWRGQFFPMIKIPSLAASISL